MEKLFHEREGERERQCVGPISAMGGRGASKAALLSCQCGLNWFDMDMEQQLGIIFL